MNMKKRKISDERRKFSDRWEKDYFFTMQNCNLICLICKETVGVLKEYNVKRHHEAKHGEYMKFSQEVKAMKLSALKLELKNQQNRLKSLLHSSSDIIKSSYSVASIIAKKMKPFSDGEFVKECLNAVIKDVLPDKSKMFSNISLSRQTICRRINDISNEIVMTLRDQIKDFKCYSLAFDESTDITDTSQLVVYIRGITESFQVKQEMLNLIGLKCTTKGEDIFQAVKKCLSDNGLDLETLSGLTTDGAAAMTGKNKGVVKLIMNEMESRSIKNNLFVIHCLIHQQNLCAQVLSMNHVMSVVVKTVNFIRSHALQHRQFKEYLNELNSHYGDLVYFTNVRWLSRAKCLKRFFDLREEIKSFMMENKMPLPELNDEEWLLDLCFLVDVTEKINQLNIELQGQDNLITDACYQIEAFQMKLSLFECQLRNNNDQHFPMLNQFKTSYRQNFLKYADEIKNLVAAFDSRFSELKNYDKVFETFSSPFHVDVSTVSETLQMEIIDLQCNSELRLLYPTTSKIDFYNKYVTAEKYPNLRILAQRVVSAFGSTYVCESLFSKLKFSKSRYRSSLSDENIENQLRCATTNLEVDLIKLSEGKEKQISH